MAAAAAVDEAAPFRGVLDCVFCDARAEEVKIKFLSCNHSCCLDCLGFSNGHIVCQRCGKATAFLEGIDELEDNYLQDPIVTLGKLQEERCCDVCELQGRVNKSVGNFYCFECGGERLCSDCLKLHHSQKATRSHNPIDIASEAADGGTSVLIEHIKIMQKPKDCKKHGDSATNVTKIKYCTDCKTAVCLECILGPHSGHALVGLQEHGEMQFQAIHEYINQAQAAAATANSHVDDMDFQSDTDELINKVTEVFNVLAQKARQSTQHLITKITKRDAESDVSRSLRMDDTITLAKAYVKLCSPIDVDQNNKFIHRNLEENCHPAKQGDVKENGEVNDSLDLANISMGAIENMIVKDLITRIALRGQPTSPYADELTDMLLKMGADVDPLPSITATEIQVVAGIAFTPQGNVALSGKMKRSSQVKQPIIEVLALNGKTVGHFGHSVVSPWALTCVNGDFYICDNKERSVKRYTYESSKPNSVIRLPVADKLSLDTLHLCLKPSGHIYISSVETNMVYCYDPATGSIAPFIRPNQPPLVEPLTVACTPKGDIVICCFKSSAVHVYSDRGILKRVIGQHGSEDERLLHPTGLCVDNDGYIYVADHGNRRVSLFSPRGHFVRHLIQNDPKVGKPSEVCISPSGDKLLILDECGKTISVFAIRYKPLQE